MLVELQQSVHGDIPLRIALFTAFYALHPAHSLIITKYPHCSWLPLLLFSCYFSVCGSRGPLQIQIQIQIQISYSEFPVPLWFSVTVSVSVADTPLVWFCSFFFFCWVLSVSEFVIQSDAPSHRSFNNSVSIFVDFRPAFDVVWFIVSVSVVIIVSRGPATWSLLLLPILPKLVMLQATWLILLVSP